MIIFDEAVAMLINSSSAVPAYTIGSTAGKKKQQTVGI
jgi:hypothetical protein